METNTIITKISGRSPEDQLAVLAEDFPGETVFTTSFGIEDQVITNMIFKNNLEVEVVTIDTGRLFPQTYKVFNETIKKYGKKIMEYFPDYQYVEKMVSEKGPFSFYYSKENRLECCGIRKVTPLKRALKGKKLWISGIRASQSEDRSNMEPVEFDKINDLHKFYPLFDWSFDDVKNYIKKNQVPYNVLHDQGFVSIGCEPCTRAIAEGDDFRAGRWWWETDGKKECGLHQK
ncbi:MAG TPA: phosphoadenylyl-sulfate reductase [Bacteroidales bacterium]|nr:phosphoadenylyl-sulfate reductase [Bacteroidales bacterium]